MLKCIVSALVAISIFSVNTVLAENVFLETEAVTAAEAWLNLVDEGEYAKSWEQAAGYFKAIMKKEAWENSIQPLRDSLGKVISRKLNSHEFVTAMPGAPDGEYVVIQFETSFENKTAAIETITPMVDTDGVWRVSGYYIK